MPSAANALPSSSVEGGFVSWCREAATAPRQYWLTRFVILRLLGFLYFMAFLAAVGQLVPLIGHDGLLPADRFLQFASEKFGSKTSGFFELPSLFWMNCSDGALLTISWIGLALSVVVMAGYANALMMVALWVLYSSIVNVGQLWYGYGWETQLLETGMLGAFLCPLLDGRPFSPRSPPVAIIWLYRWLIFRIMLGAGLIKLRGDVCWRELTCLYYHYETQPIPNPLSSWLHFRPRWFHQLGTLWNHFIEIVVPVFGFGPQVVRHVAGVLFVSFQVFLIFSGNLSFLNWLTIVPCLACFDDRFWIWILPRWFGDRARAAAVAPRHSTAGTVTSWVFVFIVAVLSISPVLNLISPSQAMNRSFDRLHLVNTYGAFGHVGRERLEIVFEGTTSSIPESGVWREYEFPAKPGDPFRRPAIVAPYQPRLDWQIWFAAMARPQDYPWTFHFVWKLLHNDRGTLGLLANDPFPDRPPRYVRAVLYRYRFTTPEEADGSWWKRERLGLWMKAYSVDDPELRGVMRYMGWLPGEEGGR